MFDVPLDMKFEDKLIKDYAKEIYEDFLSHANRRELEPDYVVNKFILELQSLGRKMDILANERLVSSAFMEGEIIF